MAKKIDKTLYTEDSIQSLAPREFCRLRPGVYCGSTEYSTQLLVEIVSNALDEFTIGHGNKILVDYKDDGSCKVEDFAQGFPINEMREDGETVLQASFDVLNTSGKFDDSGVYNGNVLGLNGIGSKLTNFLSKNLTVTSTREGKTEIDSFKDGIFQNRKVNEQSSLHTGTTVEWTPDPQFFAHGQIDVDKIKKLFHTLTCLCVGLTIELTHNGKDKIVYSSKNGINDLVDDIVKSKELIKDRLNIHYVSGKNKLDLVLTYADTYNFTMIPFVNTGETDAGPHISQTKAIITREFNKFFKNKGWLKTNDDTLSGDDINEGLVVVFNITAPNVAYDAQTKSRIVKLDMSPFTKVLIDSLQTWMTANEKTMKAIADKAISARKAREAAKKARDNARNAKRPEGKVKILHPDKLKDAEILGQDATLLVVEGLSAGSSMAQARDPKHYGILMLRGKLINAYTNNADKLMANEELQLLFKALNQIPGQYDPSKLRYGRVAICTDSDSDGYNIGMLVMSAIQHFFPQMIEEKRLCWLRSPLYIVKHGKTEDYYFTDQELDNAKASGKISGVIQRNKGLGSLSAQQASDSMFGADQHMDVMDADNEAIQLLINLMGTNITFRKDYIFKNVDFSQVRE